MLVLSQPIKRHGGKGAHAGKLAKWILSKMPEHTHFVEPYFGGGAVLLRKDPQNVSEVVNDLDGDLSNFWSVLADREAFPDFLRVVQATPFSEDVFDLAGCEIGDRIDLAADFFVRSRQSRQGLCKDFATLSKNRTRGGMNEQVSAWLTAVEGLPDVHERLKRVVVLNRPALDVIRQQDGPSTLFYLDPPYLHATRSTKKEYGPQEMTDEDHRNLLTALGDLKGKFILSGYMSDLYQDFATIFGWERHELPVPNNAASGKTKQKKTECLWLNYSTEGAKI